MMRKALGLAVVLFFASSVACDPPAIRVLAPKLGADLTLMPVDVRVDLDPLANLSTLAIHLNDVDVTPDFTVEIPETGRIVAHADGFFDPDVLIDGRNLIAVDVEVKGTAVHRQSYFDMTGDPYADSVAAFSAGSGSGYGVPANALGGPHGAGIFTGGLDVVSLGVGGAIELEFVDNVLVDAPGPDLTVFENAFLGVGPGLLSDPPYSEPGRVSVSQDGQSWLAFPCALDPSQGPLYPGCAGVYPVLADVDDPSGPHPCDPTDVPIEDLIGQPVVGFPTPAGAGGDSFDLAALGLTWARFVRIEAAPFDTPPNGPNNVGFDLDAVAAVHSRPFEDANANGVPDFAE